MGSHIETFTMLSLYNIVATDTLLCLAAKITSSRSKGRPQFPMPFSYKKEPVIFRERAGSQMYRKMPRRAWTILWCWNLVKKHKTRTFPPLREGCVLEVTKPL